MSDTATTRIAELSEQELTQIASCRDTARTLLSEATLGTQDPIRRAAYPAVADAWLALAELIETYGTPPGDHATQAARHLLIASDAGFTDQVREQELLDAISCLARWAALNAVDWATATRSLTPAVRAVVRSAFAARRVCQSCGPVDHAVHFGLCSDCLVTAGPAKPLTTA